MEVTACSIDSGLGRQMDPEKFRGARLMGFPGSERGQGGSKAAEWEVVGLRLLGAL